MRMIAREYVIEIYESYTGKTLFRGNIGSRETMVRLRETIRTWVEENADSSRDIDYSDQATST